ncbi:hypothetical protein P9112_006558 [Eukaryota sp. TZLM1-RC]
MILRPNATESNPVEAFFAIIRRRIRKESSSNPLTPPTQVILSCSKSFCLISIFKTNLLKLAPTALRFLEDFEMIVKRRTGRNFNRLFWQNRIVYSIFKGKLKMVSDALLSLGSYYERVASSVFVLGEMDFLDVDL